jgi:tetratricopeptide (TPR) repeat protein
MRDRYLYEYRRIYRKDDRIAFFEEMGEIAAAAGALVWKTFADAMSAWLRKDLGAALALSEDAIALDPECAYSWNGKGNVLQSLKRYDEALAAYDKAIALDSEYAHPWVNKGNVLQSQKHYDEALAAYDKAIALGPAYARPWINKGTVLTSQKRYDQTLSAYERAIALEPEYSHPWNCLGNALQSLRRCDEALAAYDKAIALEPDYPDPWNGKGDVLQRQERYDEARAAHAKAIALVRSKSQSLKDGRIGDPFLDRRSGDDRREAYELGYFAQGGIERRSGVESRQKGDRRVQCVNVSQWSSVCPKTKPPVE